MSTVDRLKNEHTTSPSTANSRNGAHNGGANIHNGTEAPAETEGLDELEQEIVSQLEKEFAARQAPAQVAEPQAPAPQAAPAPMAAPVSDIETSTRLLEIRRKRDLAASMEEQVHDGASLFAALAKQAGSLSDYLEKTEADLKRLERIESSSTKLRIASEGLIRNNHEMKSTIEEQRKKVALLESKIASLRDTNEIARTNLARLVEEKRIVSVDLSTLQSEVARLENDKRSVAERIDRCEEENRELKADLSQAKEREKLAAMEMRKQDDELSRKSAEIEDLRERKSQSEMEIEELKSRNASLETKDVEQRSRIEELTFEMKSGRKEMEEIIRLKQQRILELEARSHDHGSSRHEFEEAMTPPIALDDEDDRAASAKAPAKSPAKPESRSTAKTADKTETKTAAKSEAKPAAKQPAKAG